LFNQGDIGFLKVSNRVCVALSRAKIGFYMIGNTSMLQRKSKLWMTVLDILEGKQMVFSSPFPSPLFLPHLLILCRLDSRLPLDVKTIQKQRRI
jgi:hypothetical protein